MALESIVTARSFARFRGGRPYALIATMIVIAVMMISISVTMVITTVMIALAMLVVLVVLVVPTTASATGARVGDGIGVHGNRAVKRHGPAVR